MSDPTATIISLADARDRLTAEGPPNLPSLRHKWR